jgi:hypothetical protein
MRSESRADIQEHNLSTTETPASNLAPWVCPEVRRLTAGAAELTIGTAADASNHS